MRQPLFLSLALAVSVMPAVTVAAPANNACDRYVGVWEYVEPSAPGRVSVTRHGDTYTAIWVWTARDRKEAAQAPSTDAEKAEAWSTAGAAAAEMTCQGSRATFRILHSTNPAQKGAVFQNEAQPERDDGILTWHGIGPDGKPGAKGAARRLK